MANGKPPRGLIIIGSEPRIEVCDSDECPGRLGPADHTFSGYGWYARYHVECCPRVADGSDCGEDHDGLPPVSCGSRSDCFWVRQGLRPCDEHEAD